jgi:hypothetical protein
MKHLSVSLVLVAAALVATGCGAASGGKTASTSNATPHTVAPTETSGQVAASPKSAPTPAPSGDGGPAEISSCGLEAGIVGSAYVRLHGVAPGDYIVYVDFIENGVFVERVPTEVELASSGEQRDITGGSGGHRLSTTPKCEVDSVFTLPSDPDTPRMEIWKSALYASQTPEYPL